MKPTISDTIAFIRDYAHVNVRDACKVLYWKHPKQQWCFTKEEQTRKARKYAASMKLLEEAMLKRVDTFING
jgi:hypothetical protein